MTSLMSSEKSRFWSLEELGRIQLSQHFYLRDFLYSEIAAAFSLPNVPDDLELAVANGRPSPQARLRALRHLHPEVVRGRPGAGFNSLDAQREACEAYVLSQAGEGWILNTEVYDDGGFSGGTLERPALKRLIAKIEAGQIDPWRSTRSIA